MRVLLFVSTGLLFFTGGVMAVYSNHQSVGAGSRLMAVALLHLLREGTHRVQERG